MDEMQNARGACRRCLFREMSDSAYAKYVQNYLDSMLPEDRAADADYEERLGHCKECTYLQNGACRLCGCFVEIRAASVHRHCPDTPARW